MPVAHEVRSPPPRPGVPFPAERIREHIHGQTKTEEHQGPRVPFPAERIREHIHGQTETEEHQGGGLIAGVKTAPPPPPPPGGDIPPNVAAALRKQVEKLVSQGEMLAISVRSVVNSCVRNEIHMKRIEDRILSIEETVQEAIGSGKDAIDYCKKSRLLTEERYASLKSTLDSVLRELKSSRRTPEAEKTRVDIYDVAIEEFDKVISFPERMWQRIERITRYAAFLEMVLRYLGPSDSRTSQKVDRMTCDLNELKESCCDLSLIDGTYCEIGKKATDLLYQHYASGVKAVISVDASDGAIVHHSLKNGTLLDLTLKANAPLKRKHMEFTLNLQNVNFPFVKGGLSVPLPWRSAEAHIHMLHDYGAVHVKMDMTKSPVLNVSCLFGVRSFCFGGEFAVNKSGELKKYDGGASFTHKDFCASVKLQKKCQELSASLFGKLSVVSFALEYVHDLSNRKKKNHRAVAGVSGNLNTETQVKAFLDSKGKAGGAVEYRWRPKSVVALSVKVDCTKIKKTPKVGLSVEFGLRPL